MTKAENLNRTPVCSDIFFVGLCLYFMLRGGLWTLCPACGGGDDGIMPWEANLYLSSSRNKILKHIENLILNFWLPIYSFLFPELSILESDEDRKQRIAYVKRRLAGYFIYWFFISICL